MLRIIVATDSKQLGLIQNAWQCSNTAMQSHVKSWDSELV